MFLRTFQLALQNVTLKYCDITVTWEIWVLLHGIPNTLLFEILNLIPFHVSKLPFENCTPNTVN